jgi:membrane protein DedA with SNARE-associated domain
MKLSSFIFYTVFGAGIWNIVLALLGYFAHGQQAFIDRYSHIIGYAIVGLVVVAGAFLLYKAFRKKK